MMVSSVLGPLLWMLQKHMTTVLANHETLRFYFRSNGFYGVVGSYIFSVVCKLFFWEVTTGFLSSDSGDVTVGIPQGSISGVLLFSLYVNDLPHAVVSSDVCQYGFYCSMVGFQQVMD